MQILLKMRAKKNPLRSLIPAMIFLLATFPAFAQSKDSADYFFQKGLLEKQNGRRLESFKQFEKAFTYDTTNKIVLNELALACLDLRKYAEAIGAYKRLVTLGETTAANYKQLLLLSFNFKQNDDVLLYAAKLKEADTSEKVSYYIGKVHYDNDNYGEAIQNLEKASKEDPQNAEVPYMIAHCYADMENYKEAIPYFQKAVQLDTSKPYWIYEMGLIYYAINDNKNALKYILEAGDKGLKKDNAYMENVGNAYLNAGNFDQGIIIMTDVLKRKPSDINVLNTVAQAYYDKGKYQEAIDYWDKVLSYDKQNASALYMIGMSFQKKGEKEKGQQLCDRAIQMDPSLGSLRQKKMMQGL
ncbi:MAG: tetratricopeptide repeat protein [Bacteroidota bacterium]|nr:tetratricopeptide repeat protein [Bacteroidota bacterium]